MTCLSVSDEMVTWLRDENRDLRDEVLTLREQLLAARADAAEARGGERFWREVAERVGVRAIDVAAVSGRILEEGAR